MLSVEPATALALPDVRLHASWAEALRDFGTDYPHGSGIDPDAPPTTDEAGCAAFVADKVRYAGPAAGLPAGRVPCTYFWILETGPGHDAVTGFLAVRHTLDERLLEHGGHIGYSVRPSARRRGHASRALRLGLDHAAGLGLDRVLLTCDADNLASRRTIENAGGVHEDTRGDLRRYWISVGGAARELW